MVRSTVHRVNRRIGARAPRPAGAAQTKRVPKHPSCIEMARPERFELPTTKFVAWYSIQLSYGRTENIPLTAAEPASIACSRGIRSSTGRRAIILIGAAHVNPFLRSHVRRRVCARRRRMRLTLPCRCHALDKSARTGSTRPAARRFVACRHRNRGRAVRVPHGVSPHDVIPAKARIQLPRATEAGFRLSPE